MTSLLALLRYPSFVFVVLAMLVAIPGSHDERLRRVAFFSLIGLAVGEAIVTVSLLARSAPWSIAAGHSILACGAGLAACYDSSASQTARSIGMALIVIGVILIARRAALPERH